jgi:hypothetical protein
MKIKTIFPIGREINEKPFAKAIIEIDNQDFDCWIACKPREVN